MIMKTADRRRLFIILTALLTALVMALIFFFSSQDASLSSETSGFFTDIIVRIFYPEYQSLTLSERELIRSQISFFVRKTGHFSEFTLLGFSLMLHALVSRYYKRAHGVRSLMPHALFTLFAGAAYAVSDEFHQSFVEGRGPAAADVGIDTCGVLFGLVVISLIWNAVTKRGSENENS